MNNDTINLSPEKKALLALSDEQVRAILKLLAEKQSGAKKKASKRFEIPEDILARVEELERSSRPDAADMKWLRYIHQLQKIDVSAPAPFDTPDKVLYKRLKDECIKRHLPETFPRDILPSVISYMKGGVMKPLLFPGPAGCGKSTAAEFMAAMLHLPFARISAGQAELGHGYSGAVRSYTGADCGEFGSALLRNKTLWQLFLVDEIDKAAHGVQHRVSQQNELLNILCEQEVRDNFLEITLPLKHSPILFAVNEMSSLSRPFIDRCTVIEFQAVEFERLHLILKEYADGLLSSYNGSVEIDLQALEDASECLYDSGVTSIRQHQKLAEKGLEAARYRYLESISDDAVTAGEKDFSYALEKLTGGPRKRMIGFA